MKQTTVLGCSFICLGQAAASPTVAYWRFEDYRHGVRVRQYDPNAVSGMRFVDGLTVEATFRVRNTTRYHSITGKDGRPIGFLGHAPLQLKVRDDDDRIQFEFLDGYVLRATVNVAAGPNGDLVFPHTSNWTIGRGMWNGYVGDWTDGWIDEVRISNAALDPSEFLGVARTYSGYANLVRGHQAAEHYRLDETSLTDPVTDAVGNTNPGTYFGNPTLGQPGRIYGSAAVAFDGIDDYFRIANRTTFDVAFEFWIKTTTAGRQAGANAWQGTALLWADVAGVADDFIVSLLGNHIAFLDGAANVTTRSSVSVVSGNWHHVVVVRDAGLADGVRIYIDGTLDATGPSGDRPLTANSHIAVGGNPHYFAGVLDELAIYYAALTPQQIASHWEEGSKARGTTIILR